MTGVPGVFLFPCQCQQGIEKNNMIPLRATSIKDENAGGIFI
jgi:hypothetical protein